MTVKELRTYLEGTDLIDDLEVVTRDNDYNGVDIILVEAPPRDLTLRIRSHDGVYYLAIV